jgi:hypothetical protein
MKDNRKTGNADDGDEFEDIKVRVSFHADQHNQSNVDVPKSRTMKGNRRAENTDNGNKFENIRVGIS